MEYEKIQRSPRKKREGKRNILPEVFIGIFFWILLVAMVTMQNPDLFADFIIRDSYLVFFLILFVSLLIPISVLLKSYRKGGFVSVGIAASLFLRLKRLDSIITLFFLWLFLWLVDRYFSIKK